MARSLKKGPFVDAHLMKKVEALNESGKKALLSQARLYPEERLMTESQIEHFWLTRNLRKNESVTKKLVCTKTMLSCYV